MQIKKQLIKIREIITREDKVEREIGEILNTYRQHILDDLEEEKRIAMTKLIRPLRLDPSPLKRNLVLILCDQLLEII